MSDESEMVTIELPVSAATAYAESDAIYGSQHQKAVMAACKAALEARKSKYEKWREQLEVPWELGVHGEVRDALSSVINNMDNDSCTLDQARLMAAAPQLLEALIHFIGMPLKGSALDRQVIDAIRAALPEDVASEVLS